MKEATFAIIILTGCVLTVIFLAWLYIFLPIGMAKKRGRSAIAALLLFWFLSPIAGIIILLLIGDTASKELS